MEKNKSALAKLAIETEDFALHDAPYVRELSFGEAQGLVDVNGSPIPFKLENWKKDGCAKTNTGALFTFENRKATATQISGSECVEGEIQLRTLMKSNSALWFFVLRKVDALGIAFYMLEIGGLSLPQ